jgi:IS30 family transposase
MDPVVGKQGTKTVLLVLSERITRKKLIFKIPSKSQAAVVKALDKSERKSGNSFFGTFRTITSDNGCESLDFEEIENSVRNNRKRAKVHYAYPYCAWEQGANENINRTIRRFIPKGVNISTFSENSWPLNIFLILGILLCNLLCQNYFIFLLTIMNKCHILLKHPQELGKNK